MNKGLKLALIIGGAIVAAILILSVVPGLLWGWQGYGYGMMGSGMMGGLGTMFFMPVLWIVVIGLILWAVVAGLHRPGESGSTTGSSYTALEILKRRYAGGEINQEEFEARKKDLV